MKIDNYKLYIKDLKIEATHGMLDIEKIHAQEFLINIEIDCKLNIENTEKDIFDYEFCYGLIRGLTIKHFTENKYNSLEAIIYDLNKKVLDRSESFICINTQVIKTKLLNDCNVGVSIKSVR
jgi:FolB domain-containing protein